MGFSPTNEQRAIIDGDLQPQCVVACAGSGKTATAVRRMLEIRKRLGNDRGYIALLSYSNIAVDTFRKEYAALASIAPGVSRRVLISTVDSFITTHILLPHAARVMDCSRQPFLVHGGEPFLNSFKVFNGTHNVGIEHLRVSFNNNKFVYAESALYGSRKPVNPCDAENAIRKLGRTGAYTHDLARYWSLQTLAQQERLIEILARRFPYVLVDEAQDIGSMHGTLLEVLQEAGSTVSLIGDPNQAIYEFADADGSFLRDFQQIPRAIGLPLTENRRSVKQIVSVANAISAIESKVIREVPDRKHGAYFLLYDNNNLVQLVETFASILKANNYAKSEAAILCRGSALVDRLSGEGGDTGQGATERFALATINRDRQCDIASAFKFALEGVLRLLASPPDTLRRDVLGASTEPTARVLRRLLWGFLKYSDTGLPCCSLPAKTKWHPALKSRIPPFLDALEKSTSLKRSDSWGHNLTVKKLSDTPLWQEDLIAQDFTGIRTQTIHQVKGEGINAVLYVAKKSDIDSLLSGPSSEEGRIGYVAITRARDLLILGIPNTIPQSTLANLKAINFLPWE